MKSVLLALLLIFLSVPAQADILNIREVTSPGGIKAWLVEDKSIPVISMKYAFRGAGAVNDPENRQGLSRLLSNTMDEGAGELTSEQFQAILNDRSISLSFNTGRDDFGGNLKTLTKNKDEAFRLLSLALTKPRFDQEAVDRMIAANLSRIRGDMTDPEWMVARLLNSVIFKDHPYAMNSGGTLTSLPAIKPDDLRQKIKRDLTRDRLIISVSGDITEADLGTALDRVFGSLPATAAETKMKPVIFSDKPTISLLKLDIPQTLIEANLPGIRMNDPDYFAAEIMNFILGSSGFGSRLTDVIREKNGLTYGIYTGTDMMDHAALFSLSTSTQNETAARVLDLTRQEFEKIKATDASAREINDAKAYLIGSTPLSLTSTDKIAAMMLAFQRYDLPKNYLDIRAAALRKVSAADIRKVANRLLDLNRLSVVMVGNPQNITPDTIVTELPNVK